MIAKIGRSSNLFGTLSYNNLKMDQEKGEILLTNKMIETADGKYSVAQLAKSFQPHLLANRNTEKHIPILMIVSPTSSIEKLLSII